MSKVTCVCLQCSKEFITQSCYLKRGGGKFCSKSCATTYCNIHNNPTKDLNVCKLISEHHADVSGRNNPMFGKTGELAPSYKGGLSLIHKRRYRAILLASDKPKVCIYCGTTEGLQVHHLDGDHKNENLNNLEWVCIRCHASKAHTHSRDKLGRFCSCQIS